MTAGTSIALVAALISASLLAVTCTPPPASLVSHACHVEPPTLTRAAAAGTVSHVVGDDDPVGYTARDSSLTVVGFCGGSLPVDAPILLDEGRRLNPAGGWLEMRSGLAEYFFIYEPTGATSVDVLFNGLVDAQLTFARPTWGRPTCSSRTSRVNRIANGSVILVCWGTGIRVAASSVRLVDGSIQDSDGHDLGFYLEGMVDGPAGLVIQVAFRPPQAGPARLSIRSIETTQGEMLVDARDSFLWP